MPHANVYNAVYSKLTADQTGGSFYDDLSGRIYPAQAQENLALPLCVYSFATDVPDKYFTGMDLNATMQINIWFDSEASNPEAIVATNDKLIALLDNASLTMTGHTGAIVTSIDHGSLSRQDDAWWISSLWRVRATKT